MAEKIKVGGLISGTGTNMNAIMTACEQNRISAEVVFVGSDSPGAKGLIQAERRKIPTFVVNYNEIIEDFEEKSDYLKIPRSLDLVKLCFKQEVKNSETNKDDVYDFLKKRVIAEMELLKEISKYDFDLLVLAGFMRLLTPYFIDRVNVDPGRPRIMNIHPALLPSFPGNNGYEDTFNHGCKVGGCTVYFVDYGEDTGPIIGQSAISIMPGETLKEFKDRGLQEEHKLFPLCIHRFAQGRLKVRKNGNGRKVVDILPRR